MTYNQVICYALVKYTLLLRPIQGVVNLKNNLEEIRKKRGLTQDKLAELLQTSRQTINSIENEKYNPSIILAFKIATFFNMQIEEIFIYEVQ